MSLRCFIPHSIYVFRDTPTGPRPLSAERITMLVSVRRSVRIFCWVAERFEVVRRRTNIFFNSVWKVESLPSMSRGGIGARQDDFLYSSDESYVSSEFSPAKYTFRPMSRSNRLKVCSRSYCTMFTLGIGMNLSPRPRSFSVSDGSSLFCVRS